MEVELTRGEEIKMLREKIRQEMCVCDFWREMSERDINAKVTLHNNHH